MHAICIVASIDQYPFVKKRSFWPVRLQCPLEDAIADQPQGSWISWLYILVQVNNAGITGTVFGSFLKPSQLTPDHLRNVYETNVFAMVSVTNAMLPLLQQAPQGRIVNVSSQKGTFASVREAGPSYLPYQTSKTALNAVTVHYAKEFADAGSAIKINAVCPGFCSTDLNNHRGLRSAAQGAKIAVKMALIPEDGPSGGFFDDNGDIPW